nr:MAG TPA: hypothetical protein [Bacteriophage sp.]
MKNYIICYGLQNHIGLRVSANAGALFLFTLVLGN